MTSKPLFFVLSLLTITFGIPINEEKEAINPTVLSPELIQTDNLINNAAIDRIDNEDELSKNVEIVMPQSEEKSDLETANTYWGGYYRRPYYGRSNYYYARPYYGRRWGGYGGGYYGGWGGGYYGGLPRYYY